MNSSHINGVGNSTPLLASNAATYGGESPPTLHFLSKPLHPPPFAAYLKSPSLHRLSPSPRNHRPFFLSSKTSPSPTCLCFIIILKPSNTTTHELEGQPFAISPLQLTAEPKIRRKSRRQSHDPKEKKKPKLYSSYSLPCMVKGGISILIFSSSSLSSNTHSSSFFFFSKLCWKSASTIASRRCRFWTTGAVAVPPIATSRRRHRHHHYHHRSFSPPPSSFSLFYLSRLVTSALKHQNTHAWHLDLRNEFY